jgi:hypothetical protein
MPKQHSTNDYGRALKENIAAFFTKEKKEEGFKKIIKDIIDGELPNGIMKKEYFELIYNNYILILSINLYKNIRMFPKTKVSESPIHGKGLFTLEYIGKENIITFYPIHYMIDKKSNDIFVSYDILLRNISMDGFPLSKYLLTGDQNLAIGGHPELYEDYKNGHMINHSNKPNAYFEKVYTIDNACNIWMVIASKPIKKGSEILVNYGGAP